MKTQTGVLWKKPLIGFEPMTYALPWRYSTAELKGPILFHSGMNQCEDIYIYVHILYT